MQDDRALPNKVVGGWIDAVSDVPDYLLEQAKADFQGFYDQLLTILDGDPELKTALLQAWDGEIPDTAEKCYNVLCYNTSFDPPVKRNWHDALRQSFLWLTYPQLRTVGEAFGWEPSVSFTVRELTKLHMLYIQGASKDEVGINEVLAGWNFARVALTGLSGYVDPKTGEELVLGFSKVRIGSKAERVVTWHTIKDMSDVLVGEIVTAARDAMGLTAQEAEDVNFTSSSGSDSTARSTVPNPATTNESVPIIASTVESPLENDE